jgi:hypothetical protein
MSGRLSSAACAAALLLSGVSMVAMSTPAAAQVSVRIGYDFFHNRLAHAGRWSRHPIWGDVWRPRPGLVGPYFQPYTNGYWEFTDEYGWYWVSNDPFDDVVYHYGRWVYDPQWQWLWVPGYTWAPAWVVWREGDDYTGWMPMPPDEEFVSGTGPGFGINIGPIGLNFYNRWYGGRVDPDRFFVFVNNRHLVERDYRRFVVPRERVKIVLGRTRPVTKFEVVNNHVVNRGVDVRVVERAAGRRIAPVSAKAVIKPDAVITTVDEGKQVRVRERAAHPIDVQAVRRNAGGRGEGSAPTGAAPDNGTEQDGGKANGRGGRQDNGGGMSNSSGEPMSGPPGEATGKTRTRNNGTAPDAGGRTSPDQTGAAPATGASDDSNAPRRRSRGNSMNGPNQSGAPSMSGPGSNNAGAGTGNMGETPSSGTTRRRGASGMNGPGSAPSANPPAQNGTAAQPQNTQPENPAAPKKKKKKSQTDDPSGSPE